MLTRDSPVVRSEHLMILRRTAREVVPDDAMFEIRIPPEGKLLEEVEKEAVALTLKHTNGNQTRAARLLGISRPTLAKKMGRPSPSQIKKKA